MFCPLCHAEYREGFTVCSTCRAALVAADAPESVRTPPRLKWATHDQRESDAVFGKLFEASIPCLEKVHTSFKLSFQRQGPAVTLYILERDAAAARQVAGVEFVPDRSAIVIPDGIPLQDCPYCSAKFPAGQNFCPACGGDLLEWQPGADTESAPPSDGDSGAPTSSTAAPDEGEAQLVWRGDDPVTFSRALEALKENGIRVHTLSTCEHMAFGIAIPRPKLEIFVPHNGAARALELLREFQDTFPLLPQEPLPESTEAKQESESAQDSALLIEASQSIATRMSHLRWALIFIALSWFFAFWTGSVGFRRNDSRPWVVQVRYAGVVTLVLAAAVLGAASFWRIYRAWAWRADKAGLVACFFGFFVFVWFVVYVLPVILRTVTVSTRHWSW